jgi:hypothetical protein
MKEIDMDVLYGLDTEFPVLRKLVSDFLSIDSRWKDTKSADFWNELRARHDEDAAMRRVAELHQAGFMRSEDFTAVRVWLETAENFDSPHYETLLEAHRQITMMRNYDPRVTVTPVTENGMADDGGQK